MNAMNQNIIMRNSVFGWIALGACLLLLIPLIAMQFTAEVNWGIMDFAVMGVLLTGTASVFVVVARLVPQKYWLVIAAIATLLFLVAWAELAVGIFSFI